MARKRLLLVGWDSADWKIIHPLLDAGLLPGLEQLVNRGVSGNLTTLEPQLSPMLWTSIATGKMAYHHGVPGFTEVDPESKRVVPVSAATRKCRTIWEILGEQGRRSHVVSWFASQGERHLHGKMVSNMFCHLPDVGVDQDPDTWPPPPPGTYWPPDLAAPMNALRVSPHEIDPEQVIRLFVPEAPRVDQQKDRRLWFLAQRLAETFSVHSAVTHLMESDPDWDFLAVYYRAIDEISHVFMPYHAPKMEGIPTDDFTLYQNVVNSSYRLHDLFLQRLVHLAGPETAVMLVSDHGFHSDHLRPKFTPRVPAGITVWHRPQGILVASGPGIRQDELVFGARLLDVTPTILHYFGLPVGADMEGRVLEEIFAERTPPAVIPTWESPGAQRQERIGLNSADSQALLDQFVALGYIDPIAVDPDRAAAETQCENDWNMARACLYGGRYERALPLLEECCQTRPDRTDFAQVLARCQLQLGLFDEADATVSQALEPFGRNESAQLLKASIAMQKGLFPEALQLLEVVREANPGELQLQLLLARGYLKLRRWNEAEQAARKVLTADPHNPQAFLTLARLHLHRGDADSALNNALEAIGLQYGDPAGHFLLGAALVQLKEWQKAERPLLNCLQLAPKFTRAHRLLARVYTALGVPAQATARVQQARLIRQLEQDESAAQLDSLRRAQAVRKEARARASQQKSEEAKVPPLELILVSGLPRSGTSLMMQMLRAGGLQLLTDGERVADENNPEGYWEWEAIKELPRNSRILEEVKGRVIKVVSALLPSLPGKHRYRIIYMTRPVEQVVDSQWAMLERLGLKPKSEKQHLIDVQRRHSRQIIETLQRSACVELLCINYPELIANPGPVMDQLASFLPGLFHPGPQVAACVKSQLYRHRNGDPSAATLS